MRGLVFTDVRLGIIFGLIVCGGAGLVVGLTWRPLEKGTIINHADYILGDGFVGSSEFYLLSG